MKELLIEKWFPVHEASIESGRERAGANMMPPLYFLHLWWTRKPQAASRIASVLATLPADAYGKEDFNRLLSAMGLRGDPLKAAEQRIQGKKGFDYPVFEGVSPNPSLYIDEATKLWGRKPVGADFMAGGGSIPFEMVRSGYGEVVAGEYNPIAYVILKAALEYPVKYGERLLRDVDTYGRQLLRGLRQNVKDYYPPHPQGQPMNYIWVRMFRCPECGCEIPALISLWLDRKKGYALYPIQKGENPELRVVQVEEEEKVRAGSKIESRVRILNGEHKGKTFETKGFVQRGILECPRHRHTVSAEDVKKQYKQHLAKREDEGYHGSHPAKLVAAVLKGRIYVEPTEEMIGAYDRAEEDLKIDWNDLIHQDLIPIEHILGGEKTNEPILFGATKWNALFNARQLVVHAEIVRLIRDMRHRVVEDELRKGRSKEEAEDYSKAITTYLTLAFGKTLDYNSNLTSWDRHQGAINHVFDTHAYGFTWEFGEGDMIHDRTGFNWCLKNVLKSLKGIVKRFNEKVSRAEVVYGDASKISPEIVPLDGYDIILTDPPYYGNIQYGELSDYFYVWFKRVLKEVYPETFGTPDTPKQDEAVANRVRHGGTSLSARFYEKKMHEIFANMYKILRDDGVFALWFAHKAGAAWSNTINALLDAGFTITALWGVRTEMERSLHISGKASLRTNIIMTCRKRQAGSGYIQDVMRELERKMEPRLTEFEEYGIMGPDFLMGAQAEALKIASQKWPIRDPEGKQKPLDLLDFVLDQAIGHAVNYLTRKIAPQIIGVDAPTKFYVLAKYLYKDIMPYDDARRLALACLGASGTADPVTEIAVKTGLGEMTSEQIEGERAKVLTLTPPWERVRKSRLNNTKNAPVIDWIHLAISQLEGGRSPMEAAEAIAQGGSTACEVLSALYQILPDQVTEGRRTTRNREKLHVQTLLLSVCQEGLHLTAKRRIEEKETQKRIDAFIRSEPQ